MLCWAGTIELVVVVGGIVDCFGSVGNVGNVLIHVFWYFFSYMFFGTSFHCCTVLFAPTHCFAIHCWNVPATV